jgi:hypothetical protein
VKQAVVEVERLRQGGALLTKAPEICRMLGITAYRHRAVFMAFG